MLSLKKARKEDCTIAYEKFNKMKDEENGFMNPASNSTKEEFEKEIYPRILANAEGRDLLEGYVPETYFFLWDKDEIVGLFKIRHFLNEALKEGAGHIAYGILPEHRNKGYATKGLSLALVIAKKLIAEEEVFLSVHKDNVASLKVQLKNGAYIHHEDDKEYFTRIQFKED